MVKVFMMKLLELQPSQLYVSSEKLSQVRKSYGRIAVEALEPIPVKGLDGQVILTDGHTRALAAFLDNLQEVKVYWDTDELDWEAYRICIEWCKKEGIYTVADLKSKIVAPQEYEVLWLDRCRRMQEDLEKRRKRE